MIENMAFKILFIGFLSLMIGLGVLSQYDIENEKRNFPSTDQKYLPYFSSFTLPIIILLFPIILLFLGDTPREVINQLLSACFNIFLHIACYYVLLLLLLPLLRRFISSRACAVLWILPNYLYITRYIYMEIEKPTLIIHLPGKILWVILGIWFIGFIFVLAWYIISHLRYRSFVLANAEPVTDLEVLDLWRKEVYITHIKHSHFELVISPNVSTPMTIGLFKRTMKVILPKKYYSPEDLVLIFRHELVHIGHEDTWTKLFLVFCTAMCWFNPLMWIFKKKCAEDLELSCDETVLIHADDITKHRYAELILKTAGDERGFTTCLSAKAKNLHYRLKHVMNRKKRFSGAFLVGITFFLLTLSCGHIALAYGYATGEEVIFRNEKDDPFKLSGLFDDHNESYYATHAAATTNRVLCLDEDALLDYLKNLTVSEITGNYAFSENEYNISVSLVNSKENYFLSFSDEILQMSVSSLDFYDKGEHYTYYLPERTDWEFFESIISDYPVLDISTTDGNDEWFKYYPILQNVWKLNGEEKELVYEANIPDRELETISGYQLPYSSSFYFGEPVLSDFSIYIEALDGSNNCTLYPSKQPNAKILYPEDPAFYPAKFTVHATFENYEAEYQFIVE